MDPVYLVVGTAVLASAAYLGIRWKKFAASLRSYFNMLAEPKGRPWWMRGLFRPDETQAAVVAWVFILVAGGLGIIFLAVGLGADLGGGFE